MINSNNEYDRHRALKYQNILLMYAHKQYQKSIGTEMEEDKKGILEDSIQTYKNFISKYKDQL